MAGGIDYIEVDAGGVDAMWAVPKGASEAHVIVCTHGGGFAVGTHYTHRKVFGHFAKQIGRFKAFEFVVTGVWIG